MYLQGRAGDNTVESFYWIQFEHFLQCNDRTYNYGSKNTTQIGDLHFVYNVRSWPDYAAEMAGNPASDGAAIERLFEKRHLSFPHRAAHVRMFHSPSADHILGRFGKDSSLRRCGLHLAERGGKNARKKAIVAVARKLAVLLHRLWVTKQPYVLLYEAHCLKHERISHVTMTAKPT
jgi:hypothetical protein